MAKASKPVSADFKLSKNFSFYELTDTSYQDLLIDNRSAALSDEIINRLYVLCNVVLQPLRENWNQPITVNSGYRSLALNTKIKGSKSSQHLLGEAADITTGNSVENKKLYELAIKMGLAGKLRFGQLILEEPSGKSWIHISLGKPFREAEGQVMKFDGSKYTVVRSIDWTGR